MVRLELIAPCHFGLEAVLKREIYDLGYDIKKVEDGRVTFEGDYEAVCRANINLRTAERVLIKIGEFKAESFEELFENTKALSWDEYFPVDAKIYIKKVSSIKSKLFSGSDIQSIVKKAIIEKMKYRYKIEWFNEDGEEYPVRVFLMKDIVTIGLDTSGASLHKRGYRLKSNLAPISETLAAALIKLTPWHKDRILVDPFCGSGTFPIEAAMIAANIAPGVNRNFAAERWNNLFETSLWKEARNEALEMENIDIETDIQGYDIDEAAIKIARENAQRAGVSHLIHFQKRDMKDLHHRKKYGFVITNPPYGERLEDKESVKMLYRDFGQAVKNLDSWSVYVITSYDALEKDFGRKADKNRKIYNGMLKTYFYQFMGPKPPKKKQP